MIYRAIGTMSGSSLDGLDIAFTEFTETGGKWGYEIISATCLPYDDEWREKLSNAANLPALDYLLLHTSYGRYIGNKVNDFIGDNKLHHQVNLIGSHGHTIFHLPGKAMTAQLGDGATIAAITHLPVITDLRNMDVAFEGQGAPIVPIGEKLLWEDYRFLLNIGGIANITIHHKEALIAFDICPANRILNLLAAQKELLFDDEGKIAASGKVDEHLLHQLNELRYYTLPAPKSLGNNFGTSIVLPLIENAHLTIEDALRTYTEHIAQQVKIAIVNNKSQPGNVKMLVTGGGAFNTFLLERLQQLLSGRGISIEVPGATLVKFKEALIMALMGVLRWREEINVLNSVTGATQDSIGGALWLGT